MQFTANHLPQLLHMVRETLPMFAVFESPDDAPGFYVARLHLSLPAPVVTNVLVMDANLEPIQAMMGRLGLTRIPQQRNDPPKLIETWL